MFVLLEAALVVAGCGATPAARNDTGSSRLAEEASWGGIFKPERRIYPHLVDRNDVVDYYLKHYHPSLRNGVPFDFYAAFVEDNQPPFRKVVPEDLYVPPQSLNWDKELERLKSFGIDVEKGIPEGEVFKLSRYPGMKSTGKPWPRSSLEANIINVRRIRALGWGHGKTAAHLHMKLRTIEDKDEPLGGMGEICNGSSFFDKHYAFSPRTYRGHYLQFMDMLNTYGKLGDYQVKFGFNGWGCQYMAGTGYTSEVGWQETDGRRDHMIFNSMLAGAKKQHGTKWLSESEAFNDHSPEMVAQAKKRHERLMMVDRSKLTHEEKIKLDISLRRARNMSRSGRGIPWSQVWRKLPIYYVMGSDYVALLGTSERTNSSKKKGSKKNALGDLAPLFSKNLFLKHPDPGGHYAPVALMQDVYMGWSDVDGGPWRKYGGGSTREIACSPGFYSYFSHFSSLYPEFRENFEKQPEIHMRRGNDYKTSWSGTPYGGYITDTILSDAKAHLLERYGMIILSTEVLAHHRTLGDKLKLYVENGGNLILTAENAGRLWPGMGIRKEDDVPPGAGLVFRDGRSGREPYGFALYSLNGSVGDSGKPRTIVEWKGRPVLVEIPLGKGCITLSLTPFGVAPKKNRYALLPHFSEVIRWKAKHLGLFDAGPDDREILTVCSRDDKGVFTLVTANIDENQRRFSLGTSLGRIKELEEIDFGDPSGMIRQGHYIENQEEKVNSGVFFGRSEENHIVGAGVRVFRVKVSDESSLKVLSKHVCPRRRPNWYASLSLKGNLRERLYLMPFFWEYFSGIAAETDDFLEWDDKSIEYDNAWITARHVEFVVDARNEEDPARLIALLEKMSLLAYARDLLVGEPVSDGKVAALSGKLGIRLHSSRDCGKTYCVADPRDPASLSVRALQDPRVMKILLNRYDPLVFDTWDRLYDDYRYVLSGSRSSGNLTPDTSPWKEVSSSKTVKVRSGNAFVHLHHTVSDLVAWLSGNPSLLQRGELKGFVVDGFYVFSRTPAGLEKEAVWLRERGLELMVDLSARVNGGYGNISYNPLFTYNDGLILYENVVKKMGRAGVRRLIFAGPNLTWPTGTFEEDTAARFAELAEANRVSVHIRHVFEWKYLFEKTRMGKIAEMIPPSVPSGSLPKEIKAFQAFRKKNPGRISDIVLLNHSDDRYKGSPLHCNPAQGRSLIDAARDLGGEDVLFVLDPVYLSAGEMIRDLAMLKGTGGKR